jgi:DNA-binding NarL/FixJ family response regulator
MTAKTRVVIVEDVSLWRVGLNAYLGSQADVEVAGEAQSVFEAKQVVAETHLDVVIVDMAVDRLSGPVLAQDLLRDDDTLSIVMLTACDDEQCVNAMLDIGIMGLVLKRSESIELLFAVRAAARGERYVDPTLRTKAGSNAENRETAQARLRTFTSPEQDLCRLLAMGHTNAEASKLMNISMRTVETHRAQIMAKIDAESRAELVTFALNAGLL